MFHSIVEPILIITDLQILNIILKSMEEIKQVDMDKKAIIISHNKVHIIRNTIWKKKIISQ
jgi:hypothetical protein